MSESTQEVTLEEQPTNSKLIKEKEVDTFAVNEEGGGLAKAQYAETLALESDSRVNAEHEPKGDGPFQDEDGNLGFVIIKPGPSISSHTQMEGQEDEDIFIIQGPDDLEIDGLDSEVLSQVKKVLAESGVENSSVMIVNEGHENACNKEETTTYIIDLNSATNDESQDSSDVPISTANCTVIQEVPQHHHPILNTSQSPPTYLSSSSSSVLKPLVSPLNQSASVTVNTISISTPSVSDNVNIQHHADINEVSKSSCTNSLPKNLNQSSHNKDSIITTTSDPTPSSSASPSTSTSSTVTTSQVAEQLIHIAKKMIEDSSQGSQNISIDESLGKIVISSPEASKQSGEKSPSESVITMYLSSPNELKLKLKKLKTNSPVIVMQAGEEPEPDENKENPLTNSETDKGSGPSVSSANEEVSAISQRSDNIVAALSSLASREVLYRCSECGYSSHNKHYYKQHVDLVHNEERPYKCPHCDYAGKRRHALLEHMVVHSNQRPYSCNHCNASFRKKGHLTNHVKLHMSHRLVHCGVCNIQLPDAEAFEAHLRKIHNTDKLYKCKLCEHTVVERRAMIAHLGTHNESIVFSCPNCSSYFNDEDSLLTHMKNVHGIDRSMKVENDKISNTTEKPNVLAADKEKPDVGSSVKSNSNVQSPNILCSECGFMCTDTQVMKKHMWVHIDSSSQESGVQLKEQAATSKKNVSESSTSTTSTSSNSAMGVLKMNVVSGMKSLPENIVYQCTSCKFTSSDNSVFIKHMLQHKTQRNQQVPVSKDNNSISKSPQDPGTSTPLVTTMGSFTPTLGSGIAATSSVDGLSSTKVKKPDSAVPFVYDQPSGRYRCLICGYHCDFQRTIKAHIWKHSGNQNIEYPVFEQAKKSQSSTSSAVNSSTCDRDTSSLPMVEKPSLPIPLSSSSSSSQVLPTQSHQSMKTNTGRIIQLLPFNPSSTMSSSTPTLSQIKGSQSVHVLGQKSLDPVVLKDSNASINVFNASSDKVVESDPSSPQVLIIEDKNEVVDVGSEQEVKSETEVFSNLNHESVVMKQIQSKPSMDEGCTEPSVVVEIVDSIPSSFGLTGMKSQQGSPRVSDLEGSGNETKLSNSFKEMKEIKQENDQQALKINQEVEQIKSKYNLRKSKTEPTVVAVKESLKLKRGARAVDSDSIGGESEEASPQKRVKTFIVKGETVEVKEEEVIDEMSNDDSDDTASSDDTVSAGESSGASAPPKSGICSSLLAVIEQLRERSRSDSLSDKDLSAGSKDVHKNRSSKRKSGASSESVSTLSQFHNIEKIHEGGGEKFRCSLCHYTSHRICNMKIHMKTHRQKKPSECSLCDFASASPELLQEHMLQHCKVRTYACKFCPQSFNHKSTLRAHMRAHKDHEPFLCAYCVFETTNPNEYREHMHVHSGCSSRLRCPGCDHVMNSKEELTPHLMICKGKSSQSPTPADESRINKPGNTGGKSPKQKDAVFDAKVLSQFTATPTPQSTQHSCVVEGCSFSSFNLKELQDHLSVHCNPSLMVCDLCDFKALHSRSLKSHMKRHANDQRYVQQPLEQYKCNLCGYVCHHLPSLKSHMWRHASDQSYSYEFTNDVINAAIDHDSRADISDSQPDDPELLVRFINSESRIMEGELTNFGKGDGQRPTCWVTFRCCSCGFETINKAKLNIHMRSHSDIIQQALDVTPRKPGYDKSNHLSRGSGSNQPLTVKSGNRRSPSTEENNEPNIPSKTRKGN